MPRSAQAQHQMPLPSIRRTPLNEFNCSQPLLTLAFPTHPDGKANFVEPLEAPFDRQSLYNHTPTEVLHLGFLRSVFMANYKAGMKMRLADQQRREAQLTDPLNLPRYAG